MEERAGEPGLNPRGHLKVPTEYAAVKTGANPITVPRCSRSFRGVQAAPHLHTTFDNAGFRREEGGHVGYPHGAAQLGAQLSTSYTGYLAW